MKKVLISILALCVSILYANAQIWQSRNVNIHFFSSTPIEDINATSKSAGAAINAATGKIYFTVDIITFKFAKSLMEEHFNENYMESEKYPKAVFDGQILNMTDFSKDGEYKVNIKGKFTVHGVTQDREIAATLNVSGGVIKGKSIFKVKCVDHKINIPKLVVKNIAEEIEVTVNCELLPKKN